MNLASPIQPVIVIATIMVITPGSITYVASINIMVVGMLLITLYISVNRKSSFLTRKSALHQVIRIRHSGIKETESSA